MMLAQGMHNNHFKMFSSSIIRSIVLISAVLSGISSIETAHAEFKKYEFEVHTGHGIDGGLSEVLNSSKEEALYMIALQAASEVSRKEVTSNGGFKGVLSKTSETWLPNPTPKNPQVKKYYASSQSGQSQYLFQSANDPLFALTALDAAFQVLRAHDSMVRAKHIFEANEEGDLQRRLEDLPTFSFHLVKNSYLSGSGVLVTIHAESFRKAVIALRASNRLLTRNSYKIRPHSRTAECKTSLKGR